MAHEITAEDVVASIDESTSMLRTNEPTVTRVAFKHYERELM